MKKQLLISISLLGLFVAASAASADIQATLQEEQSFPNPRVYRSSGAEHKLLISATDDQALGRAEASGATQLADYGAFRLFAIQQPDPGYLDPWVRDDFNVLFLRSGPVDTTAHELQLQGSKRPRSRFQLVHFVGPVRSEWLESLRQAGVEIIAYVPNNGYLVRTPDSGPVEQQLADGTQSFVQWTGPFTDEYKVDPALSSLHGRITVAIQIARSARSAADIDSIRRMASEVLTDAYDILNFTNLKVRVDAGRLADLASLEDVVNVEPWTPPQMFDERASQIAAGELSSDGKQARGPGYLAWLQSHGLNSPFGFVIDVTDSGADKGSTQAGNLHSDFLDSSGQSRLIYARDYTVELDPGDPAGHGTINLSIAGGGNTSTEPTARDSLGYNYGLGIAPGVLLGSSKIFRANGRFDLIEPFTKVVSEAYSDGARISSNSWGAGTNAYTLDSQEYDLRVRDATPSQPGAQELVICFAAGNSGSVPSIGSPSSAKNVIAVAASENWRPTGSDGCGISDEDADSAADMAFFSSAGPLRDGRLKPDITAAGTHIQGAASQHAEFNGAGICGKNFDNPYFPDGQKLYTWSSGTSHSTPQVAGAAALVRQFFLNRGREVSPAFVKALLTCTATYITGEGAGGDLPHPRQGWGLLNLGRAFDGVPKILVDQTRNLGDSGQEFVITGEVKDPTQPLRVSLAWSDAPGFSGAASWVNDLDLEVVINGSVYRGNNFKEDQSQPGGSADSRNNVEGVRLPAGTTGFFLIRVRATNIAGDGVPGNTDLSDQDFALVVYNGEQKDVAVAVLDGIAVNGGGDSSADPGESVSLKVRLRNVSATALSGGKGTLGSSTQGIVITSAASDFPNIGSGSTAENLGDLTFNIDRGVVCGGRLHFLLQLSYQGSISPMSFDVPVGSSEIAVMFEDSLESGDGNWKHGSLIKKKKKRVDTWVLSTKRFRSGGHSWFTPNLDKPTDANLDTVPIALPANGRSLRLVFYHTFSFERFGFDGGVIEISTGGDFEDLGPKIIRGGYNGTIRSLETNALSGRAAWIEGRLGELSEVVVDLDSFAGKTVVIRFRVGTDEIIGELGWYVDDVSIKGEKVTCTPQ